MKLNYFSKTVVGLVRKTNEDNIGSITKPNKFNINLRIVCDGMGGHIGGAKASKIAVESIQEYFSNNPNPVPQVALKEAISFANLQIFGAAQAEPEFKGMGTTCTALLESEGLIYIAHVGDSRIYIQTDQKLYRITKDHSYVQELVDRGEITDQQMETHPKKNQLTRALGIGTEIEVEVVSKPILAKSGDAFMLCSDGLSGLINDKMINSVLTRDSAIETKVNNLITMAESAGGHDNISVDLIEILKSEHIKTQFVNKNNEDLIDTKTQQLLIDKKSQTKKPLSFLKNKVIITSFILGLLIVGYFVSNYNDSPLEELKGEENVTVKIAVNTTDTIKVLALDGWGKNKLDSEFYERVSKKVGKENYCKDCPLFFREGKYEPISIQKYRSKETKLKVGDYLMVSITEGEIYMPEINRTTKNEDDTKNVFPSVDEEKFRLKKEREDKAEAEAKAKADAEAKAKEEKERQKAAAAAAEEEEDSADKQRNNNTTNFGPARVNRNKPNPTDSRNNKKNTDNKINSKPETADKENDSISSKKE